MLIRFALVLLVFAPSASAQWTRQPAPSNDELYEIVALTDQRLVSVGRDGTILQTENGGATWTLRDDTNPFADAFRAAFAVDTLYVVAATEDGALYKSLDGGLTWALAGTLPVRRGDFFVYDVHFRSRNDGWIVGSDFVPPYRDFMWRTTDGGGTWTSVFLFEDSRSQLLYVDFEGEKGWTGSDGGTFFRTTDGGQTWTQGALPDPGVGIDVLDMEFASDGLTGFAGGWDRYLVRSTDGGVTWALLDFEIGAVKFSDFHLRSPADVWASTYFPSMGGYDDGIVYHSTDGGQTGTYEEVGADPNAYGSFSGIVVTSSRAYVVGFGGFIYTRETDPVPTPVEPVPDAAPAALALAAPAPNPARGMARLTLTLAAPQAVRVEAFDALGRRVAVLHDGPLSAGTHALSLDAAALTPGLYVVRATGAGGVSPVRRVVVAR